MRNLEWFDGAPDKLEPGMLVFVRFDWSNADTAHLIGYVEDDMAYVESEEWIDSSMVNRWTWVIKPHELEWAADMAGKHAKGRPEQ